uniref:Uncharacterized protein n=1 Tax=Lactuca sativa TaxID=4236 RepID=A0A9R1VN60_LACSA|nr:hypothetical protein LSAT_V11C400217030 [Lactuca sativa]
MLHSDDWLKADVVGYSLESFDFIFMIHLMKTIFGVSNDLNNALQRKDQDIFNTITEFDEASMDLLVCRASLIPVDDSKSFYKEKIIALAKLYPSESLNYGKDDKFQRLKDLRKPSKEMVRLNKNKVFDHVYLLINLVLILFITPPNQTAETSGGGGFHL